MQTAAQDLAGVRSALAEAITVVAAPTTGVVSAAGDEVSAAVAQAFGGFDRQFQTLSAQAQAFYGEFVDLLSAGAGAYLSTEIANAEQALAGAISAPAQAILGHSGMGGIASVGGSVAAAGTNAGASSGPLGGLGGLRGGTGSGGSGGLTGIVGGLTGVTSGLGSAGTTLGGVLGGLTGTSGLSGILGGLLVSAATPRTGMDLQSIA